MHSEDHANDAAAPDQSAAAEEILAEGELAPDRRAIDRHDEPRRKHERADVGADAMLRSTRRNGVKGAIRNLSEGGCCIETASSADFSVGEIVVVKIDGIEGWPATIRWIVEDRVGIQFDRPFYPAVFERFVEANQPVTLHDAA